MSKPDRQAREAAALRANLLKRKQQARQRQTVNLDQTDPAPPEDKAAVVKAAVVRDARQADRPGDQPPGMSRASGQ